MSIVEVYDHLNIKSPSSLCKKYSCGQQIYCKIILYTKRILNMDEKTYLNKNPLFVYQKGNSSMC